MGGHGLGLKPVADTPPPGPFQEFISTSGCSPTVIHNLMHRLWTKL